MPKTVDRPAKNRFAAMTLAGALALPFGLPSIASAQGAPPPEAKGGVNLASAGMNKLDQMLAKAEATPDQKAKIKAVMVDAFMSLASQAQALKSTGSAFGASLMTPHVDRAGLESARLSAVSEFDTFSKVMVKALGDAAEVLTPEQRAKLAGSSKAKTDAQLVRP